MSDEDLTLLGRPTRGPVTELECFPAPDHVKRVRFTTDEVTSVCPITGQPDFATVVVRYVPDRRCVELKSLKTYLQSYRQTGVFYEALVNRILEDLVAAVAPRRMEVRGEFRVRGGISSVVTARHPDDGKEGE